MNTASETFSSISTELITVTEQVKKYIAKSSNIKLFHLFLFYEESQREKNLVNNDRFGSM
jgi:hypothetical protein